MKKYAFATRGSILCCMGLLMMFICASSAQATDTVRLQVLNGQGAILTDATVLAWGANGEEIKPVLLTDNSLLLEMTGPKLTLEISHPQYGVHMTESMLPYGGLYTQVDAYVAFTNARVRATRMDTPLEQGFAPPVKVVQPTRTPNSGNLVGPGPANDMCAAAIPIFDGPTAFSTIGATTDGPDEAACADFGDPSTHNDIWFTYVATCDGDLTVSTCGTVDYDSKLNVYTGTACPPTALLGCNDDGPGCAGFSSLVTVPVVLGNSYLIRIGGFNAAASGSGTVDIECAAPPPPLGCPPGGILENEPICGPNYVDAFNGGCNSAPPVFSDIACGDTVCGEAGTFTTAAGNSRDTDWYRLVLTADTNVMLSGQGEFPFLMGIVDNFGVDSCAGVSAFLAFTTAGPGQVATVTACLPAGTWYLFAAPSDFTGVACGSAYTMSVSCAACTVPTGACCFSDGTCTDGTESDCIASGGTYQGDGTDCASAGCAATCGPGAGDCFTGNGTPGCEDPVCCAAICAADSFCCDVTWDGICAAAAMASPDCGFVPPDPPANDLCINAESVSIPSTTAGTTNAATDDNVPTCGTSNTSEGVWYSVIGTGTTITASTCNDADFDTKISVFCSCDGLECVDGNDDTSGCSGFTTEVSWCSQNGAEYLILIHGFGGAQGNFNLTLSEDGVACSGAVPCLPEGACCTGSDCAVSTEIDCMTAGGVYLGDGTDCGSTTYVAADCTNPFEDIAEFGTTAPNAGSSDDAGDVVPLGFTFNFFGADHTDVGISSNGYLTFGSDLSDFSEDAIPSGTDPNDLIAPLWNDYSPNNGGTVQYMTLGTAPNRRFIAQWTGIPQFGDTDSNTFQAVLFEGSNCVEYHYGSITAGMSVTIGVENQDGSAGVGVDSTTVGAGSCISICPIAGENPCPQVFMDIDPGVCPNIMLVEFEDEIDDDDQDDLTGGGNGGGNAAGSGDQLDVEEFPDVAIMSPDFDVTLIDLASISMSRADGVGFAVFPEFEDAPLGNKGGGNYSINGGSDDDDLLYADVATPFEGAECGCHDLNGDGILDLVLEFEDDDMAMAFALDKVDPGTTLMLRIDFQLLDGTAFEAFDCVIVMDEDDEDDAAKMQAGSGGGSIQ